MNLVQETSVEQTIDAEFDQTAPHIHVDDSHCPTCQAVAEYHEPAVLDQRIRELEEDLRQRDLRIKAFERFTASLAAHIDGMQRAVEQAISPRTEYPRAA
ncbi:MAG: hypothetical protein PSX80_07970 [bacterium]|nr:hypothetical protein [bacterium]